jgi:hypothetical protein
MAEVTPTQSRYLAYIRTYTNGGDAAVRWAGDTQAADRIGCICDKELAQLRDES